MITDNLKPSAKELIEQNQGLVYDLAQKIRQKLPRNVEFEDLVSYGQIGLGEAARDFDTSRGVKFSTFAYYRIRGAIYDGISQMNWGAYAAQARYAQAANDALSLHAKPADGSESTLDQAKWIADRTNQLAVVFLCSMAGSDNDRSFDPVDPHSDDAERECTSQESIEVVKRSIEELPDQDRCLITDVYFRGLSIQEAGKKLRISKSWASRVHSRALEQLLRSLRRAGIVES